MLNNFLMWLGGLLIAVFALLFAGPHFVDWNSYRGIFEEEATRVLGRRVRVGGNVNIRLLPAPYVLVEDLRLADTTGIAGAPLFRIDSFKMWLSVPPLLKGLMEANKIELQRPVLSLAADDEGYGNWRTLLEAKAMPFVPAGVKLDSVVIEDGTVSFSIEQGGEIARVDKISGELTAQALAGPYSFRGTAAVGGVESALRVASTEANAAGDFRMTAQVIGGKAGVDHKFDGQVRGLWGQLQVSGDLVSKIDIEGTQKADGKPLLAEVRSKVKADGGSLALDELVVSFEDFAQPQLITGTMKAQWARRHQVDLELNSRWLDIDKLTSGQTITDVPVASASPGEDAVKPVYAAPLPTARRMISQLLQVFPDRTDLKASLDVEQINLGGETVSGLAVAIERSGGPLELRTLKAILPGGARLAFSGQVESVDGAPVFDGNLFLGGVSAARVIRWGVGSSEWNGPISDGPFSVSGRMQLGSDKIMLRSAVAEFSGVPVRGDMTWDDGQQRRLDLSVEGYEIDTRWFGLGKLELPALSQLFAAAKTGNETAEKSSEHEGLYRWLNSDDREVNLTMRAGRLSDGSTTVRDVEALIRLKQKKLSISRLKLVTAEGLKVDADGQVEGLGGQPKGSINYLVEASDQTAAWKLADLWAGDSASPADRDRFAAFAPIRVAGGMTLGRRSKESADFSLDGVVAGGRVEAQLKLDGGLSGWLGKPVDFVLRSDAGDTGRLFSSLAGIEARAGELGTDVGRVLFKVVGVPETGLLSFLTVDSDQVSMVFDGTAGLADGKLSSITGELQLRSRDVSRMMPLVGLDLPAGTSALTYDGLADVAWSKGKFVLTPRDVDFAGVRVGGRLSVTTREDRGPVTIDGELISDSGSLPRLLSVVLSKPDRSAGELQVAKAEVAGAADGEVAEDGVPAQSVNALKPIFSDRVFDLSSLKGINGSLKLKVGGALEVVDGFSVRGANADIKVSEAGLQLQVADGQGLGGTFSADLEIQKIPAGASVKGSIALKDADVSQMAKAAGVAGRFGTGRIGFKLDYAGRGLSPRGMMTVLSGQGELNLDGVVLEGLDAAGVRLAAEEALSAELFTPEQLSELLLNAVGQGQLKLGQRDVKLAILDGAVRVSDVFVESDAGKTKITTTLDLRTLGYEADWQIVASDPKAGRPWPAVSVGYVGPLAALPALQPSVTADALERELAVRKMERNVNELERLRRLDEEAARRQRERERELELESQRIEAERAAAAAAAAAAAGGVDGNVGGPADVNGGNGSNLPADPNGAALPNGDVSAPAAEALPESVERQPLAPAKTRPRRRPKPKPKTNSLINQVFGGD